MENKCYWPYDPSVRPQTGIFENTLRRPAGSSRIALRKLSGSSQETLSRLSGNSQQALRRLSAQESLRKLSGSSQETLRKLSASSQETLSSGISQKALRKLSGDDFSEPAGSRVGPLPPALRRTRKLPRGVEYVRTQDHRSLREHFVRPQIWHTEPPPEFGHLFVEKHA